MNRELWLTGLCALIFISAEIYLLLNVELGIKGIIALFAFGLGLTFFMAFGIWGLQKYKEVKKQ